MEKDKKTDNKDREESAQHAREDRLTHHSWKDRTIDDNVDEVPETPEPTPTPVSPHSPLSQSQEAVEDVILTHSRLTGMTKEGDGHECKYDNNDAVKNTPKTRAERKREKKRIKDAQPKSVFEFRIVMPMTADQLNIGFQYTIARSSVEESTEEDRVRVLSNKSCVDEEGNNGQHTLKVYYIKSYFPAILSRFMSNESLEMYEDSKDCFPHTFTECTSRVFKSFSLLIETRVVDGDRGHLDNALGLSQEELGLRNIVDIDILNTPSHYPDPKHEPGNVRRFEKSDVCCLRDYDTERWREEVPKVCCAYKLVKCNLAMPLATMITRAICKTQGDVFTKYYKRAYTWADCWAGMSIRDVESMTLSAVEEESEDKSLEIRRDISERRRQKEKKLFGMKSGEHKKPAKDNSTTGDVVSDAGISSIDGEVG